MCLLFIMALVALVAFAIVLLLAAAKPNHFRLARSIRTKAPPVAVYTQVIDLRRWTAWSPWEGVDPDLKRVYEGAPSGVGQVYGWDGSKTGVGRMEVIQARAPQLITIKLDVLKPFVAHNTVEFTFEPLNDIDLGHVTAVTWSMHGPSPFLSKLIGVVFGMDRIVGKDFEKGLIKLKALAEG